MTAARKIAVVAVAITTLLLALLLKQRPPAPSTTAAAPAPLASQPTSSFPHNVDPASWDERWQAWLRQLAAPGHEAELANEFESLVLANPRAALARARQEPEPRRSSLIQTILILWSGTDLAAAATEVRKLPDSERALAVAAVISGAIAEPDVAIKLAVEFCRDDPALASEHGYALIAALGHSGEFRRAIQFAAANRGIAAEEDQSKWLKQAFTQWAEKNPTMALAAMQELPEPGARFEALEAITANRVHTDPRGLAESLRLLPPGPDRSLAIAQALRGWVRQDPKTAADWLDRLEPNPDLDGGAAAVADATQAHVENRRPEVALSWAQSIVAPELRSRTIAAVVQKWASADLLAARSYAENSPDLLPDDRAALAKSLSATPATEAH